MKYEYASFETNQSVLLLKSIAKQKLEVRKLTVYLNRN